MTSSDPPVCHPTGFAPLDALLHGGLPRGGVALLVGSVGVGKSVLLTQCSTGALYVGCDEVASTTIGRAARIGVAPPRFHSAVSLTRVLRAVATADAPCVLVDGAQELGRPVFNVVHALAEAARVAGVAVLVAFARDSAAREAEHVADVVLRLTRGTEPRQGYHLACTKHRYGPTTGVIGLRLTRAGFIAESVG